MSLRPLLLACVLVVSSACATTTLPEGAGLEERARLAGQTLECAGQSRERMFWAILGATTTSMGASVLGGLASGLAAVSPPPVVLAVVGTSCALASASLGLSLWAIVEMYLSSKLDQRAGRVLAGSEDEGCVSGFE